MIKKSINLKYWIIYLPCSNVSYGCKDEWENIFEKQWNFRLTSFLNINNIFPLNKINYKQMGKIYKKLNVCACMFACMCVLVLRKHILAILWTK